MTELFSRLLVGFSVTEIKVVEEVVNKLDLIELGEITKAMSKTSVGILSALD